MDTIGHSLRVGLGVIIIVNHRFFFWVNLMLKILALFAICLIYFTQWSTTFFVFGEVYVYNDTARLTKYYELTDFFFFFLGFWIFCFLVSFFPPT